MSARGRNGRLNGLQIRRKVIVIGKYVEETQNETKENKEDKN